MRRGLALIGLIPVLLLGGCAGRLGTRPVAPAARARAASVLSASVVASVTPPVRHPDTSEEVPDCRGMFADDAVRALTHAGYWAVVEGTITPPPYPIFEDTTPSAIVWRQSAKPGELEDAPTTVTVYVTYPHGDGGSLERVSAVHGRFYLRYGALGSRDCLKCHGIDGCEIAHCHAPDTGKTPLDSTGEMIRDKSGKSK